MDKVEANNLIIHHFIIKIFESEILPCHCGKGRKIIQNKEQRTISTQCNKCNSTELMNMADLSFLIASIANYVLGSNPSPNKSELIPIDIPYDEIWQMIQEIESWSEERKQQKKMYDIRRQWDVLNGGKLTSS